MKSLLPFLLLLVVVNSSNQNLFSPSFLQDDMTDKEETEVASEETIDLFAELFSGISTDLAEGEEFTAEVPEEFQDDEALVKETSEVDDILDSMEGVTVKEEDDFYEGIKEVEDIVIELDGDQYIIMREEEFDHDTLAQAVIDANELHEASMMSEGINDLEELWDEIEETGETTIENLEAQVVAVNQILNYMEEDEIILLDGEEYTYEEVAALVEEIEAELAAALSE